MSDPMTKRDSGFKRYFFVWLFAALAVVIVVYASYGLSALGPDRPAARLRIFLSLEDPAASSRFVGRQDLDAEKWLYVYDINPFVRGSVFFYPVDKRFDIHSHTEPDIYLRWPTFIAALVAVLLSIGASIWSGISKSREIIQKQVADAERAASADPKAVPLWQLANSRIELFFARNQTQSMAIFWIMILVATAGFTVLGYAVYLANTGGVKPAKLTFLSGCMTEFIAATFLVVYSRTMKQTDAFVQMLKDISTIGIAIQLVEDMPDSSAQSKQKERVALIAKIMKILDRGGDERPQKKPA
jgi:hypothetical protein